MSSKLLEELIQEHKPELVETMQTEQYRLSNQIVQLRVQSNLRLEDLATKLGITPEDYIDYEYGETKYSVEEYKHLINKIEQIKERSETRINEWFNIIKANIRRVGVTFTGLFLYGSNNHNQAWYT